MTKLLKKLKNNGLDVSSGLYYCNGSEELYLEILATVLEESVEKKALFEKSAVSGDVKGYYREAHALKNVSATIGADNLTNFLTILCTEVKASNTLPSPENVRELQAKYEELLEVLKEII
jgi:HPt (histidine-containing phosphotransfer) domain-containing protein